MIHGDFAELAPGQVWSSFLPFSSVVEKRAHHSNGLHFVAVLTPSHSKPF